MLKRFGLKCLEIRHQKTFWDDLAKAPLRRDHPVRTGANLRRDLNAAERRKTAFPDLDLFSDVK